MSKVAVAMSGGVDSSVAAVLAVEKHGKENVFGVTMKLYCYGDEEAGDKSCCSMDAIGDAASVCRQIGINHYVINVEKEFQKEVIDDFIMEYSQAKTPNPCIRCNQVIKFDILLKKVQELGADTLATGHYARILLNCHSDQTKCVEESSNFAQRGSRNEARKDKWQLLKGVDPQKDQSYFLYNLTQDQLEHVWFPLGGLTKTETRKLAGEQKLKTAMKTESQDICFITTNVADYLSDKVNVSPGEIVDGNGKVWGTHRGLPFYTIGQRKGLGGGFDKPMFVVGLNIKENKLIIGPKEALFTTELSVLSPHWISGNVPKTPIRCFAKIRYAATDAECVINTKNIIKNTKASPRGACDAAILVSFTKPQEAITPGQSVVFYDKEVVLGGGIISL